MRKLWIKIFVIFLCLGILYFQPFALTIHIYADPASTPALLQMRDFINQPEEDFKIINWNRYYKHIDQKKFKNTIFLQTHKYRFDNESLFFQSLEKIIKKNWYKKISIHLHFNLWHDHIYQFLITHPLTKNKIKSIHAYEDSTGRFLWDSSKSKIFKTMPIKPFFYHWGNPSKHCQEQASSSFCRNFNKEKDHFTSVQIDLKKISASLSDTDKKKIFDLAGFDYSSIKKMLSGKKTHFYILGYDYKKLVYGAQISALKTLCSKNSKDKGGNHETFFYKNHPSNKYLVTHKALSQLCPGIQSIPSHLPFELLLISGFEPHQISGYSSSLFFNLDHEKIGIYIERNKDPYTALLKKSKNLKDSQIFHLEQQQKHLEKDQIIELVYDEKKNKSEWYLQLNESTLLNIQNNKTAQIEKQSPTTLNISLPKNKEKSGQYQKDKFYRYILSK